MKFLKNRSSHGFSERFQRLSKEGFLVGLGQAMALAGSIVGVRMLTELLTPVAYGELALGITLATLVNQTIMGPLSSGVMRFYAPACEAGDLGGYLKAVFSLVSSATGLIILITLVIIFGLWVAGDTQWIGIAVAALFFAVVSGYNSILDGIQNAGRQRSVVALHQGMSAWLRFQIAAGLLMVLGATSTVAMVGYAISVVLVIGSQYVFFRRFIPGDLSGTQTKRKWRADIYGYLWPISTWGIFTWAQLSSDRWALGIFATTQEVGLYTVLFQLGYYPMMLTTGMGVQFIAPIFYQQAGDASDSRRNAQVSRLSSVLILLTLGLTGLGVVVALVFHAQIFRLLVSQEYRAISHLLPWMLFAGGITAASQVCALNLMSQMKTRIMAVAKICTAVLGVLFNIAGAYAYGITGIVMAGVLFSVLSFFWMMVLLQKISKIQAYDLKGQ